MIKKHALEMRTAIDALFRLTNPDRYCVAITERYQGADASEQDYELHLYLRDPRKSGQIELALLARAIEDLGTHYLTVASTYDAGTEKGTDTRNSIKIW